LAIENLNDDDLVCYCIGVDKKTIVDSIHKGNITLQDIRNDTKACTGKDCKVKNPSGICCSKNIKELIEFYARTIDVSTCGCCSNQERS
jgi:NAD(P)H-nitrite reductase large subunit